MKDETPESRLGVYKQIEDVPPDHRLDTKQLDARSAWDHYRDRPNQYRHAIRHWRSWADDHDINPALAEPDAIKDWAADLLNLSPITATNYWSAIYRWHKWMLWHPDYPHRYNSLLLAAATDERARQIWDWYLMPDSDVSQLEAPQ